MSPLQLVYTKVKRISENKGYDTYDTIPPDKVNYPYVYLGEQSKQNVREHKEGYNQQVQLTLHVWHNNQRQRGTFVGIMDSLEQGIVDEFGIDGEDIAVRVIDDPSDTNLMHGILDVSIKI